MRRADVFCLLALLLTGAMLHAQASPVGPAASRRNSFGIFAEYSNSSSHMLLGQARQRKLLMFGASYSRRLLLRPALDLQYLAEVRPLVFVSDPVVHATIVQTATGTPTQTFTNNFRQVPPCRPGLLYSSSVNGPGGATYATTATATCARQWTFGEGLSPAGFKLNLLPRHALQPVLTATGGYLFSAQAIPLEQAGSFNFLFGFGAGLELYRGGGTGGRFGTRSIRAEYRYQHISNNFTAVQNPGIDSGVLQVTYAFGR